MRVANSERSEADGPPKKPAKRSLISQRSAELIPLYDQEQFIGLVERERARADRAAARPPKMRAAATLAPSPALPTSGAPKPSSQGVWGATTDNREFSLVMFRPVSRTDRAGLVELLQCCVRTTDAVGVIDSRRLGVLLPDTAMENAVLFVKKVFALAEEQDVQLSHIVHTYPGAWPDDDSPMWHEPRRGKDAQTQQAKTAQPLPAPSAERGLVRSLTHLFQLAAFRRPVRGPVRA